MATLLTNSLSQSKQEITKYHGTQHRKEKETPGLHDNNKNLTLELWKTMNVTNNTT